VKYVIPVREKMIYILASWLKLYPVFSNKKFHEALCLLFRTLGYGTSPVRQLSRICKFLTLINALIILYVVELLTSLQRTIIVLEHLQLAANFT